MATKTKIVLDADVIIHFIKGGQFSLLLDIADVSMPHDKSVGFTPVFHWKSVFLQGKIYWKSVEYAV